MQEASLKSARMDEEDRRGLKARRRWGVLRGRKKSKVAMAAGDGMNAAGLFFT